MSKSYGQILKSSSIIGGAAGINLFIGMIRTKFVAVLIGTSGVGILAGFNSVVGLFSIISGLGIRSSAVKDIAQASITNDKNKIAETYTALRKVSFVLGLTGMLILILLSSFISTYIFDNDKYTYEIASLGLIILISNITGAQTALLQGMRRIKDVASLSIIGAFLGSIVAVAFYYFFRLRGILPSLILISLIQLIVSSYLVWRIKIPAAKISFYESFTRAYGMITLGISMMWTGVLASLTTIVTISFITRFQGLDAVGVYNAAFALSGMFVAFILDAMGTDYFPRISAISDDFNKMGNYVNEQVEIGLLIGITGLIGTIVASEWIIKLFYTKEFADASNLIHWFILGSYFKIIQQPIGLIQLALSKSKLFFINQTIFNTVRILLIIPFLILYGIEGVAFSFFVLNLIWLVYIYTVARKLIEFRFTKATIKLIIISMIFLSISFVISRVFDLWLNTILGVIIIIICFIFCIRNLLNRTGTDNKYIKNILRIPGLGLILGIK